MSHTRIGIEVLATSIGAVRLALMGGADRIELCATDAEGGTTPSIGTLESALVLAEPRGVPVHVMLRPRGGGFVYDTDELAATRRDLQAARRAGAHGFVVGFLTREGDVDRRLLEEFVENAEGRPVTFHRAVDASAHIELAVETAFDLGCTRVLTSGGAPTAAEGARTIARLVRNVRPGAIIMAGGSIRSDHVCGLVSDTLVPEIHVAARVYRTSGSSGKISAGDSPGTSAPSPATADGWPAPDVEELARLRDALVDVAPSGRFGDAD